MKDKEFKLGYLAPLNYDRFFQKVFSELSIAKQFLEDFLDIKIQEIETLKAENRFTDGSQVVIFDFRCKIDNKYVVIEMQQWYKPDIVQRFLLYHSINIGLQLESLPEKHVYVESKKKDVKIKDYRRLAPTVTLIWLVNESLGLSADYMNYSMYPEVIADFIRNSELWKNPSFNEIREKRDELLEILNNKTKELDFLQANKLIFMFQRHIVKSHKLRKYKRWFEFAEKTKNFSNTPSDFSNYNDDPVFSEMINRLQTKSFSKEQFQYVKETAEIQEGRNRYDEGVYHYGFIDGEQRGIRQGFEQGIEQGIEQEKQNSKRAIKQAEAEKEQEKLEKTIFKLLYKGKNIEKIAQMTGKDVGEIKKVLDDN